MFNDDPIINALLKWAALEHSAAVEAQLDLPWHRTTAAKADKAYREAAGLLCERAIYTEALNLFPWARAAFKAHLKLRQELAEIDPAQLSTRSLMRAGAFTWARDSRRRADRD